MNRNVFWALAASSLVVVLAAGFVLIGRIVALRPLYASPTVRGQALSLLQDARDRYGLSLSYAVPTTLFCENDRCRMTLREPFNLAISSVERDTVIVWSLEDATAYVYDVATD